ncbi:MAG: serine/threonine protein kinase bacterial [Nitrospirae bacterium]|nr:MAG: serine/threonine protein kinase bacterial [Nitrospirota bacterium]
MNRWMKIPLYGLLMILFGILSGYLTFTLLTMNRTVDVPDLRGKGMVEANDLLRSKNLYIRLEGDDYDASVPQGFIVRQSIPAGGQVKQGREIGIILSRGSRIAFVPDVVGQTIEQAETVLQPRGIKISKVVYVRSDSAPKDTIIAQRPEPLERGGEQFSVLVSLGDTEAKPDKKEDSQ